MSTDIVESPDAPTTSADGLVLPFVQREELVAARENLSSLAIADLAGHSPAYEGARRANAIVQAIVDVNTARKLKQKRETFTHTNVRSSRSGTSCSSSSATLARRFPRCALHPALRRRGHGPSSVSRFGRRRVDERRLRDRVDHQTPAEPRAPRSRSRETPGDSKEMARARCGSPAARNSADTPVRTRVPTVAGAAP